MLVWHDILENAGQRHEPLFVLILDTLQNPQNPGTLIRTAESVGVHGVLIPTHRAAEITPAVASASAGTSEHMLVVQANLAQSIDELKEADAWVVGLDESPNPKAFPRSGWMALWRWWSAAKGKVSARWSSPNAISCCACQCRGRWNR